MLLLSEAEKRRNENKIDRYLPHKKQRLFHQMGASKRERLLRAGNQNGKTYAGGNELSYHLTGLYPDWWEGRRFDKPVVAWASSNTGETTRDNPQRALIGLVGEVVGTGSIPKRLIVDYKPARGVADLLDYVKVSHVSGGVSTLRFKYYEQGRQKWQGPPVDIVWFDEEPPDDVYSEGKARTIATDGIVYTTFTPLLGMSSVVRRFLSEPSDDRADINMTIDDAEHIPAEERERIIAGFPAHERDARAKGIPILGSGRIFPVADDDIKVTAFKPSESWPQIGGLDFGWDHPTAAVKLALDEESDTIYIIAAYKKSKATPVIHAAALKAWGPSMPWAWPHDGFQHDKGSGETLKDQYTMHGLNMLFERATFADGGAGVEAGIMEMLDRMQTGRLKVFGHLEEWFEEFRLYHRRDGKVVKENDDLLSATRYAMMMLRHAVPQNARQTQLKTLPPRARQTLGGAPGGGWMK